MKIIRYIGILTIIVFVNVLQCAVGAAAELRQTLNFNREWKFQLGDYSGAEAIALDDANWDSIGLPHSFSIPYFLSPKFYTGYGWYRKHFNVSSAWQGKRIFLEFDGAFQVAEVFVNGLLVGEHKGGYTGFSVDITEAVKPGDNVVAVRVNNFWNARLAPRAGEHVFSGGIYRDVRLVVAAPLHVAWYGTFATSPEVSKESGTVNVKTEVVNSSSEVKSASVKTSIFDADGKQVAEMQSAQSVPAGATVVFDQTSSPIAKPMLWHPDHPYLYSVKTTVLDGGKPVDDFTSTMGFRWFKWTADQGFFLNGEHYYFKGANVHQDHAGWGDAVTDAGFERDIRMVKDAGFDFIRGSHYPHDPSFSDACDRLGMLFWSENNFWGSGGFKGEGNFQVSGAYPTKSNDESEFKNSVRNSLRDMIRINRNHPSIVVWSMSNEPFFTEQSTLPNVRKFLKELVELTHELDPARPAAIGGCQRGDMDKLGDIAGYNGDGARLFINPGIPNVVSEYGSTIADRPGKYEPGWGDLPKGPDQDKNLAYPWRYPWRSGEVIWCAFDHGSHAGHFGCMGMIDYFRLPKRQWYWYRNEYKHIPLPEWPQSGTPAGLKLTADKTIIKSVDGTDDAQIVVTIVDSEGKALSNSPPVTLTVESGPGEFPTGASITFDPKSDIVIRDGQAAIELRSYYSGKSVIRATSPGLKDATITIEALGEPKFIAGKTPLVKQRPYVRFNGQPATVSSSNSVTTFGLDNPTRASSEAPGHSARAANDGNSATFWQANEGDFNAWWQVDMERLVTVERIKLTFPSEKNYRYQIEISNDGANWKPVVDQTQTKSTVKVRTDSSQKGANGRFLRVSFPSLPAGTPAALVEVEVSGSPGGI
jgi:beta-galactosidase